MIESILISSEKQTDRVGVDTLRIGCKQVEGQHHLNQELSNVLSATSAFSTDDMLMRTRVQVIARRPKVENALGQ